MPPTPWTVSAQGGEDIAETFGFLTNIMTSYNGFEQRMRLREIAKEGLEFTILADGREAQLASSLIWGLQATTLAVPLWQYGSRLTADLNIGESLVPISDAQQIPYRRSVDNGGYVLVWSDPFTYELLSVDSTGAGGVTTTDTAAKNWLANKAWAFPAREARITDSQGVRWLSSRVLSGRLRFSIEEI